MLEAELSVAALDALDIGVAILDAEGRILAWNAWLEDASDVTAEASAGRTLRELFAHARLGRLEAAIRDAHELGASSLITHSLHPEVLPLRTRTGRPLVHNLSVRPLPGHRCVVQVVDVTAVAERERVLRKRQNARYDAVVESAPDPILTLDDSGVIQFANRAVADTFGYPPEEMVGRLLADLIANREAWDVAWPAMATGGPVHWPVELAVRRKDGTLSYADCSASCWTSDGRTFVTAILRDVNERRAAEAQLRRLNETLEDRVEARTADLQRAHEQLRQSQKMEAVGQLTGGVAHDFNNLLTPILGGLDVLQRRGIGDARGQRLIEGALQSAERARVLVQRLLAFARRQPLQATAVDVGELVRNMTDLISSTIGPRVRVVVDMPPELPPARADLNQLEMALLNLAVNGRDAMPDGGVLTVSVREGDGAKVAGLTPGRYVGLTVSDTGVGMDAQTLSRAVEPFFSTKGVGKGTGLGLSMIHGLAGQLGGALDISSTPGLGTSVAIWLPVAAAGGVEAPQQDEVPGLRGAGSVLLVDDEDLVRQSTAHMLSDLGYRVTEAGSGAEALEHLQAQAYDLLVTDHLMPGMTGVALAREAQALRRNLRILIISGYADLDEIAPDLPRLTKPFLQAELATCLSDLEKGSASPRQSVSTP